MACTTILVGKKASYDGSTMIARNDDSGSGHFTAKKFVVVQPEEHPAVYKSVISHVEVPLPGDALRMTAMPNAVEGKGIWAASGVNAANVGMTATETITSNPRVLGADPLVVYQPARDGQPEVPGGIGEEDIVYLVLPYIHSAREGVLRLGKLLEEHGTYEMNGIAFQDVDEIWGQLGDVPAGLVEHPGEEVPEIVREDLGGLHARVPAQGLQLRPDLAPAQLPAAPGAEYRAGGGFLPCRIAQQLAAELPRQQDDTYLALERYLGPAPFRRLHGDIAHLADSDAGGADCFHDQRNPLPS